MSQDPCLVQVQIQLVSTCPARLFDFRVDLTFHANQTASAITIMMMAAALHPEAQAKVQEELDSVVGREKRALFFAADAYSGY